MAMAEGRGQGIGDMIGLGDFGKTQQGAHHPLDLLLRGAAVAGQGLLDLEGGYIRKG